MSKNIPLTLACGEYEITRPLMDGTVQPDGIDLTVLTDMDSTTRHWRFYNNQDFDMAEASCSTYLVAKDQGLAFDALPVFLHRRFQEGNRRAIPLGADHHVSRVQRGQGDRHEKDGQSTHCSPRLIPRSVGGTRRDPRRRPVGIRADRPEPQDAGQHGAIQPRTGADQERSQRRRFVHRRQPGPQTGRGVPGLDHSA